jgi:hypothetical protein
MIDLNLILDLLKEMQAEINEGLATPKGRDAFAYGEVVGQTALLEDFKRRLNEKINKHYNENEDN